MQSNKSPLFPKCHLPSQKNCVWCWHFIFSPGIQQIAYDWLSRNWYFTDSVRERIFACNENGSICITLLFADLKAPQSIVVDPMKGSVSYFNTLLMFIPVACWMVQKCFPFQYGFHNFCRCCFNQNFSTGCFDPEYEVNHVFTSCRCSKDRFNADFLL